MGHFAFNCFFFSYLASSSSTFVIGTSVEKVAERAAKRSERDSWKGGPLGFPPPIGKESPPSFLREREGRARGTPEDKEALVVVLDAALIERQSEEEEETIGVGKVERILERVGSFGFDMEL